MDLIRGKTILITGGTGSLGQALTEKLLPLNKVVVLSRNEERQFLMKKKFASDSLSFFIGDVTDLASLRRAIVGCDVVIHAAAMKDLDMCESQPSQAMRNNVLGSEAVIAASLETSSVQTIVAVSTDKAATPSSVYGCTKYIMEKLFLDANYRSSGKSFLSVRFGNMLDSTGSLLSYWRDNPNSHADIRLSHPEATRFFFTVIEAAETVIQAAVRGEPGETWIRNMKKIRIVDAARIITGRSNFEVKGLNPGEKPHEFLVSDSEAPYCFFAGDFYVYRPNKLNPNHPPSLSSEWADPFSEKELRDHLDNGGQQ